MSGEPNVRPNTTADPALPPTDLTNEKHQSTKFPVTPEMPGSDKTSNGGSARHISLPNIPKEINALLSTTDDTLVRLNKVLRAPGGLQAFFSSFNYGLYILAHVHATSPSRAQLINRLATLLGRTPSKAPVASTSASTVPTSPILPLALTIGDFRTTLRLTGLIPLYVLLRSLIKSPPSDKILYAIKLTQVLGYMGFQLLENVLHLTNKTVLTTNFTNTRFARFGGQAKLMTWACRSWLTAITCEFLRLGREAQIARNTGSYEKLSAEEKKAADRKWWTEAFAATSWYPMAIHYSVEGGIGLNLGVIGCSGFFANLANFLAVWQATK